MHGLRVCYFCKTKRLNSDHDSLFLVSAINILFTTRNFIKNHIKIEFYSHIVTDSICVSHFHAPCCSLALLNLFVAIFTASAMQAARFTLTNGSAKNKKVTTS